MANRRASIKFRAEVFREGDAYVAISAELNVSSFGSTVEEAQSSLQEAVAAFVEECERMGTLEEVLEESGFHLEEGESLWVAREPARVNTLVA